MPQRSLLCSERRLSSCMLVNGEHLSWALNEMDWPPMLTDLARKWWLWPEFELCRFHLRLNYQLSKFAYDRWEVVECNKKRVQQIQFLLNCTFHSINDELNFGLSKTTNHLTTRRLPLYCPKKKKKMKWNKITTAIKITIRIKIILCRVGTKMFGGGRVTEFNQENIF